MAEPARRIEKPHERAAQLHRYGLPTEATIVKAVRRGFIQRQSCLPVDPPSYPGTHQWAMTHRALRLLTITQDWTPDDRKNFSRTVSPDRTVAVTVATGDEHVGVRAGEGEPRTRYPKGSEVSLAIETNVRLGFHQLSLLESEAVAEPDESPMDHVLWFLLITTTDTETRSELSCAAGQDEEGRVVSWSERIIFDPIDIDSLSKQRDDQNDDQDDEEGYDVPVERI